MATTGTIFDIKKFSVHDGPGIRTTVFLKGCPLNCWWCHNPESQASTPEIHYFANRCILCGDCAEACPNDAISLADGSRLWDQARCELCGECAATCPTDAVQLVGSTVNIQEVMDEIEKDVIYYDQSGGGVTFSGGEPLQQIDFLDALLTRCKDHEIHTAVDTSGLAAWSRFERILPKTDLFLYDLKHMDDEQHRKYTGVSNRIIHENLTKLTQAGAKVIVRIPIIPGINDGTQNLHATCDFLTSLGSIEQVDLLPYHSIASDKYQRMAHEYVLKNVITPSDTHIQKLFEIFEKAGFVVKVGG